jgi:hypothetical protein
LFCSSLFDYFFESREQVAIAKEMPSETIDWDAVVKVSTVHFLFPAVYCNLKCANFLQFVPQSLSNFRYLLLN